MTLGEIIINCRDYNEFSVVYAKKWDGKFLANSEASVLVLEENEIQANTDEIARQKCPGYDYFLEIFLIQEMLSDLEELITYKSEEDRIERVIYFAENDA